MAKRVSVAGARSVQLENGRASKVSVRASPPTAVAASPARLSRVPNGPPAEAVTAFEAALGDLQLHNYKDAAGKFRVLLTTFPSEHALLDRVRVYLELCNREQQRRPSTPITVEERVTLATAALNNGENAAAERLALGVLADAPDHDLALYLLAAVHARRGETQAAMERLERAVAVSPDVRAQARHDTDFDVLRGMSAFRELLTVPVPAGAPTARRSKRSRSDR